MEPGISKLKMAQLHHIALHGFKGAEGSKHSLHELHVHLAQSACVPQWSWWMVVPLSI